MLLDDALLVLLLPLVLLDLQVVKGWDDLFVGRLIELVEAIAGVSIFVEALFKEISQIIQTENGEGGVSRYNQQVSNGLGPNFILLGLSLLGRTQAWSDSG